MPQSQCSLRTKITVVYMQSQPVFKSKLNTISSLSELLKNSRIIQRMKGKPHTVRLALHALETGGGERVRTDDPLLAKQVLSQLSYPPVGARTVGQTSRF